MFDSLFIQKIHPKSMHTGVKPNYKLPLRIWNISNLVYLFWSTDSFKWSLLKASNEKSALLNSWNVCVC